MNGKKQKKKNSRITTKPAYGKKKFHGFRFATLLLAIAVGFELVFGTVALVGINVMLDGEPKINLDDFNANQSTLIFDRDGNQIADVGAQLRENITYDDLPEAMVDAFLSIEDSRFFTHNGFDVPRFLKSIVDTVLHGNLSGGSTFTMQLVKLTYFQNDDTGVSKTRNIQYKIQQIDLAIKLEKQISKKQIFEMYLNKMNFGGIGNIRGVQKAAQQYFGKNVSDLNLSECALLAGVINSPYYYDPHNYLDHATDRRNTVLNLMKRHGYITDKECELAKSIRVEDLLIDATTTLDTNGYQYQAYIDEALKEAADLTGQDPLTVSMEIHTAMNPNVQTEVEKIEAGENPNVKFTDDLMEMGTITMNNQTGEIIAIGGGRNYAAGGSMLLNHATEQYKQPGSIVKPFLDYAPTFDYLGWSTAHELDDHEITYGNWTYSNAGGKYYGIVDLGYATVMSLNTPAIQAMQRVIDKKGLDWYKGYMKSLGFAPSVVDLMDISYSIGGNNFTCTVKQMAGAHATEMNGGNYIPPHTITKIVFRNGSQEDLIPNYTPTQVMSDAAAYMTSDLMYQAVHTNVQNYLPILQRNYATYGKTGTTDWGTDGVAYGIPKGAMKDKWMVTNDTMYTTVVWVGWEKAVANAGTYFSQQKAWANVPGHISSEILDAVHSDGSVPETLAQPESVKKVQFVKGSWPYLALPANFPQNLIATGYIKADSAKLKDFAVDMPALENLSSFNASWNSDNTIHFDWAQYPVLQNEDSNPNHGNHDKDNMNFFNPQSMAGTVKYKARVTQEGITLGEVSSDTNILDQFVDGVDWDSDIQVCGYYSYENTGDVSNEMCVAFHSPKAPETQIPDSETENNPDNENNTEQNQEPNE